MYFIGESWLYARCLHLRVTEYFTLFNVLLYSSSKEHSARFIAAGAVRYGTREEAKCEQFPLIANIL